MSKSFRDSLSFFILVEEGAGKTGPKKIFFLIFFCNRLKAMEPSMRYKKTS